MQLSKSEICARIPHSGDMCLLAHIVRWDQQQIVAIAQSHREPGNPLRSEDRLHAICGIEYAAQAMAVHASLVAGSDAKPSVGFLASVRDFRMSAERLDLVPGDLEIRAERLSGSEDSFVYAFEITAGVPVASGRVAVKLMGALNA